MISAYLTILVNLISYLLLGFGSIRRLNVYLFTVARRSESIGVIRII